ncbi:Ligand-binding domain of nuclear hormone receptor [Dictyocaulus viviparus]|uniref:Ligand-binding domain of nuclear hormone receptor n=1 Tax=Dictyocaulus viviparus TaxID=29172 RepID=A0A0D8XCA8_DICVI|nr:Ligand-binding domain of nuclear hormone receptor [Dictyocaulus viviparus]
MKGDTSMDALELYPLTTNKLRDIINDPRKLKGKRCEMRYEPFRMAKNNELSTVSYRQVIAAIDWVEHLATLIGGLSVDDRVLMLINIAYDFNGLFVDIALVKNAFAPLMVFKTAARTAEVTKDENILCLCNFSYVPRNISRAFSDSYHLGNGLVDRTLDELVTPYRSYGMEDEEIVCISALIVFNPLSRDLSTEAFDRILEMRSKIEDTLFIIIKEARVSSNPVVCFGNILLSLPIVTVGSGKSYDFSIINKLILFAVTMMLANTMCENMQFAQAFLNFGQFPLLTDLFGYFLMESSADEENTEEMEALSIAGMKELSYSMTNPSEDEPQHFHLLQPPGNYTLTEMFDDLSCHMFEHTSSITSTFPPTVGQIPNPNGEITSSHLNPVRAVMFAEYPPLCASHYPSMCHYMYNSVPNPSSNVMTQMYSNSCSVVTNAISVIKAPYFPLDSSYEESKEQAQNIN